MDLSDDCSELVCTIRDLVSLEKMKAGLKHFTSTIRLVGFQTIQAVVTASSSAAKGANDLESVAQEVELWKEAFPFAIKTDGKEYKSSLLQCLTGFMDRLLNVESVFADAKTAETESKGTNVCLPLSQNFVIDFLIFDVVVRQAAYPASISEKEAFASELLNCILAFASRDSRFVPKNVAAYERKRRPSEVFAAKKTLEALASKEGLGALFALLHSAWDGSRSSSFRFLSRLVLVAQATGIQLAPEYTGTSVRSGMMARGVYLASSPRQRESDTGARILAFLNFSLFADNERWANLENLIELLDARLISMKTLLTALLSGQVDPSEGGTRLPLAHGLIQALQLVLEQMEVSPQEGESEMDARKQAMLERLAEIFCVAIQVSLAVVADVNDGSIIEGMDEDMISAISGGRDTAGDGTPLNVNTGAIGANGTFSSVHATEEHEHMRRIAIQRIVVSKM